MANLEGKKAPPFSLDGNDGKTHALDDYKGKTVVLYFYPKDDTPGCTKEACGFREQSSALKKSDVVVLGVSKDSVESHNRFAGKYKLPFTLLSDPKADVMKKYGGFGKKNDVWQGSARNHPFDSRDRPQRRRPQTLVHRKKGRGSSGRSAGVFEGPVIVRTRFVLAVGLVDKE
jgi:peroxiredoxin